MEMKDPMRGNDNNEIDDPGLQHQIICKECGMVYELRYIAEHCRKSEGEGYFCLNCNAVLKVSEE